LRAAAASYDRENRNGSSKPRGRLEDLEVGVGDGGGTRDEEVGYRYFGTVGSAAVQVVVLRTGMVETGNCPLQASLSDVQ
jgi:hypothetical protein